MSCSIHFMLEHRKGDSEWRNILTFNKINSGHYLSDCYDMYGVLGNDERGELNPIIPNRGFPTNAAHLTIEAYCVIINSQAAAISDDYELLQSYCPTDEAEKWVNKGLSKYIFDHPYYRCVSDPDNHHPNWCTTDELSKCIEAVENLCALEGSKLPPDWYGIYEFMRAYETHGYECRIVYWFDN